MSAQGALRDGAGADFDLIETMRWEPEAGFVRLERHLARLYGSAHALGFNCDAARVGGVLSDAVARFDAARRVRLVLSPNGNLQASTQPYEALAADKVWSLRIARTRLNSADPLVRY